MLQTFLTTIYHVFLPISFPVIGGALLRRFRGMETSSISMLSLYVLSPALIFEALFKAQITFNDISKTISFSIVNLVLLWGLAALLGKVYSLPAAERAGLTMVSIFTNNVNYGLPLILLAMGQIGSDTASIYVIVQLIIANTLGVYFAARSHFSIKNAIKSVFSMPAIYAMFLAILLRIFNLHVPETFDKGLMMMSDSFSPVVLAILGAQMISVKNVQLPESYRKAFKAGLFIRLIAAPLIAYIVLYCLSIKGILFTVLLVLASMPTAVNTVILAEKFNSAPLFVSKSILWTTLTSFVLLPVILVIFT